MDPNFKDSDLIEEVKKFQYIYDKSHREYRNKPLKYSAWKEIGGKLGTTGELAEHRWTLLRNRYATEIRINKMRPSTGPLSQHPWRNFNSLKFLEAFIAPRKGRNEIKTIAFSTVKLESFTENNAYEQDPLESDSTPTSGFLPNPPPLRPIAPKIISTPLIAKMVSVSTTGSNFSLVPADSKNSINKSQTKVSESECMTKTQIDDEDLLFGKSIGHALKNVSSKKTKLQIKSEILAILAKYTD